jgi:hypothetical protein
MYLLPGLVAAVGVLLVLGSVIGWLAGAQPSGMSTIAVMVLLLAGVLWWVKEAGTK